MKKLTIEELTLGGPYILATTGKVKLVFQPYPYSNKFEVRLGGSMILDLSTPNLEVAIDRYNELNDPHFYSHR